MSSTRFVLLSFFFCTVSARADWLKAYSESFDPRNSTKIDFELKIADKVSLGVFDRASGRLVRTLLRGESLSAGKHAAFWDGFDNRGNPVQPGEYQWRLVSAPGFTARYVTTIGK